MNNIIYVLNEESVPFEVKCEIDLENLECCEVFETENELRIAALEDNSGTSFHEELITINEDEIISSQLEGTIGAVDSDVAVYVSSFGY
jgi:hypothetical protein